MPQYVFEHISLDLITHLPVTAPGHDSFLAITDRLSKLVLFYSVQRHAISAEGNGAIVLVCGGCTYSYWLLPSAHLANGPTALANFLATWGGPHVGTCISREGG